MPWAASPSTVTREGVQGAGRGEAWNGNALTSWGGHWSISRRSAGCQPVISPAMQAFSRVIAPFAGTIAARNYDIGALITPSNPTAGHELFQDSVYLFIGDEITDRLRFS